MTLPEALLVRIEKMIRDRPELGFVTVTEYIRHVVWRALEQDETKPPRSR